jgi:four helix bundle protein
MKNGFKSLLVWQKAMTLVEEVYELSKFLPEKESFSLTSQIRRSAISVPSNIAEGSRRSTKKDYIQFLRIAYGSLAELETQLLLTQKLYPEITTKSALFALEEVSKMLNGLIAKLSSKL